MTTTLVPSAESILACCADTLTRIVLPNCQAAAQRSATTTVIHLLRYAGRRVEAEGDLLFAETFRLRALLSEVADDPAIRPGTPDGEALRLRITDTLGEKRPADVYPSVARLSAEIAALRQRVCEVLALLHAGAPMNEAAVSLHGKLRAYLAWQLEQEATIVEPSFIGHGPRR